MQLYQVSSFIINGHSLDSANYMYTNMWSTMIIPSNVYLVILKYKIGIRGKFLKSIFDFNFMCIYGSRT